MRKSTLALAIAASISLASCSADVDMKPAAEVASTSESTDTTNPPSAAEQLAALYTPSTFDGTVDDAQDWDGGTITTGGTYRITGDAEELTVDAAEESVVLVLDNAHINGQISIDADRAALILEGDSTVSADGLGTDAGAIHATSDLATSGDGTLSVRSDGDGIVAKDDLVFNGGTITVNAGDDAIRGTDSVTVYDNATLKLTAGGDGITSTKDDDDTKGWIHLSGGTVTTEAGDDALSAATDVIITGGTQHLTATDKGINAARYILTESGQLHIDADDDAIHSDGALRLTGGEIEVTAQDDGVHAEVAAVIDGAKLTVLDSEEALEAGLITVTAGDINLTAADDGINASGSTTVEDGLAAAEALSVESSAEGAAEPGPMGGEMGERPAPPNEMGGGMGGGPMDQSSGEQLNISGGVVTVNAGGDGIDSNGDAEISGGTVIIHGPTRDGNGALDVNGTLNVNGGELWAVGSAGMAEAPSDSSTQAWVQANVDIQENGEIAVADEAGNTIATLTAVKTAQNVVYSSPSIDSSGTYDVNGAEVTANTATSGGQPQGGPQPRDGADGFPEGAPNGAPGMPPSAGSDQQAILPPDRREDV